MGSPTTRGGNPAGLRTPRATPSPYSPTRDHGSTAQPRPAPPLPPGRFAPPRARGRAGAVPTAGAWGKGSGRGPGGGVGCGLGPGGLGRELCGGGPVSLEGLRARGA